MPIAETLLAELTREAATTRKCLERIPEDALDWRPHRKSMRLRHLAAHLAQLPCWGVAVLTQDVWRKDSVTEHEQLQTLEAIVGFFDRHLQDFQKALKGKPDDYLQAIWCMEVDGVTTIQRPRALVLRTLVLNHMIHHRAQLGVYLRLQDVPLPPIYGPTADEGL